MSTKLRRGGALVLLLAVTPPSAAEPAAAAADDVRIIEEAWLSEQQEADNVDSVATWHDGDRHWLIATAKSTDLLQVFDAVTGARLQKIGGPGDALGRFLRPNGISVVGDLVVVVERDNRRLQVLALPDFDPVGAFGSDRLELPYGLWIRPHDGGYRVYVTDNYALPGGRTPPDEQLDRRVQIFDFRIENGALHASWAGTAGETAGPGRLPKVESIFGDEAHDRLLVADETETEAGRVFEVYRLDGSFAGAEVGRGVFRHEPEGIALYACRGGSGYWVATDQHERDNRFHVFDRESLEHLGSFSGAAVRNTDGIWLTRSAMPGFPHGAIYAVHDDGSVGAFRLDDVLPALNLQSCEEE